MNSVGLAKMMEENGRPRCDGQWKVADDGCWIGLENKLGRGLGSPG